MVVHTGWKCARGRPLFPSLCLVLLLLIPSSVASASTFTTMIRALQTGSAYISPLEYQDGHAHTGDVQRLNSTARTAGQAGVPEKFVLLHTFDKKRFGHAANVASYLRNFLSFSGVLIVVSANPGGIGVSSDRLTTGELSAIQQQARPFCLSQTFTNCAIRAGNLAVSQLRADQRSSDQAKTIFWIVVLAVVATVMLLLIWSAARRRRRLFGHLTDLRRAANNTLSLADGAVEQIETTISGRKKLPSDIRRDYDRALALRDQARTELDRAATAEILTQANHDAAQAVLALQGIMQRLGIESPLSNPLNAPARRCFYCAHEDRPPYTQETIDDGHGNRMVVDVCAVCEAQLQAGRKPQIATASYSGMTVPWWAIPNNPWYYAYGGPSWQMWLPFFVGMDVGSWFGGGWGAGGNDWGAAPGGWGAGDAGAGIAAPSDAGSAASGDWDTGGWDSGGGFDAGSGDFGSGGGWDGGGGDWGSGGGGGWS